MSHCKVIIVSQTKCFIRNCEDHILARLISKYSMLLPGYQFSKLYKLGVWDGRVKFVKDSGESYTQLLGKIIVDLKKLGCNATIEDKRPACDFIAPTVTQDYFKDVSDIVLRYYQVDAVNAILNHESGIIIGGTGAGKTLICAAIMDVFGKQDFKTMLIVPDQTLLQQTYRTFENVKLDVGEYSGRKKDVTHLHTISTWQALKNNQQILHDIDVVIIDECHKLTGKVLNDMLVAHGENFKMICGVTGSLPDNPVDRMTVQCVVGEVKYTIPAHQLIAEGWLSTLQIYVKQLEESFILDYNKFTKFHPDVRITYPQFKQEFFPDFSSEKTYLQRKTKRIQKIADMVIDMGKTGNTLCLTTSKPFSKKLSKLIPDSIFISGNNDVDIRQQVYDAFETTDNMIVIATIQVAGTGLSIDRIYNLCMIDVGKPFTRIIQAIGRGLRKGEDKNNVNVFDICSDTKYSKQHLSKRIGFYKGEKYPYVVEKVVYEEQ